MLTLLVAAQVEEAGVRTCPRCYRQEARCVCSESPSEAPTGPGPRALAPPAAAAPASGPPRFYGRCEECGELFSSLERVECSCRRRARLAAHGDECRCYLCTVDREIRMGAQVREGRVFLPGSGWVS